jgi:uncharacterized protein (TIGR02266 family)
MLLNANMNQNKELLKQELFKVEETLKQVKAQADEKRTLLKENQEFVSQIENRIGEIKNEIKNIEAQKIALDQKIALLRKDELDQRKAMEFSQTESRTYAQALGPLHLQEKGLQTRLEAIESKLNQIAQQAPPPQPVVAQPQPVVAQPQPVVAQPQPVVAQPQPVVAQPQPVVAQPQPVVAQPQPAVQEAPFVRSAVRVDAELDIDFDIDLGGKDSHTFYTGFTKNISEGGLFISTAQYLEIGHKLTIDMQIPPSKEKVKLQCEVKWVRREDSSLDGFYGVGVQFVGLSPEVKQQINDFIKNKETLFYED